ncbi:MAG: His/Gly/Thr/Pro-type tRNA ligase C-terminal domain-containing protein, partial [Neisseriaceae bacterium]|nr:His/Gly/Thr/Pro-type tRNA ligase C-terminal domain-containing protein [Neisseriaceae bacterium]
IDYCCELDKKLQNLGIRTVLDTRNEKIGFKIREQHLQKIPYIVIIGDKERENNTISVRHRSEDLGSMPLDDFVVKLKDEIKNFN